jgi:hypothetical protein
MDTKYFNHLVRTVNKQNEKIKKHAMRDFQNPQHVKEIVMRWGFIIFITMLAIMFLLEAMK